MRERRELLISQSRWIVGCLDRDSCDVGEGRRFKRHMSRFSRANSISSSLYSVLQNSLNIRSGALRKIRHTLESRSQPFLVPPLLNSLSLVHLAFDGSQPPLCIRSFGLDDLKHVVEGCADEGEEIREEGGFGGRGVRKGLKMLTDFMCT